MKDLFIVFKFELLSRLKNKTFIISTIIVCFLLIVGLSIPTIKDIFFSSNKGSSDDTTDLSVYGFVNRNEAVPNVSDLKSTFTLGELREYTNEDQLKEDVLSKELKAGYIIEAPNKYQYIILNNEITASNKNGFEKALIEAYRVTGFEERGISYSDIEDLVSVNVESDTKILGKDSARNFIYTYILVFGIYFMVLVYGQLIATSVASEKSNRAMEVLITSTDSSNLIFGKVLGVALAGIIQFGLIISVAMITYTLNATAWENKLDFIFNIPGDVLLIFSIFGILGYLFYSFIYGALGALVSRTEDVGSSSTPITLVFVAVFIIAVTGMQNTESILLKITSFIPFSSFMSMFIRVSMGTVSMIEVIISLVILAVSTIIIGLLASAIYRLGTLMYGNSIKLKTVIKMLREDKK